MTIRPLAAILSAAACLTVATARADQRPPENPKPERSGAQPASLEQRIAALEDRAGKLLQEAQALRNELKAQKEPAEARSEFEIIRLKHMESSRLAKILQELIQGKDDKDLRIVADAPTNSLIVRGTLKQLELVRSIVLRRDEAAADAAPIKK